MANNGGITPDTILQHATATLRQRGMDYDGKGYAGGERSMEKTIEIFKAITGTQLTVVEGWYFMLALKLARSTTGKPKLDTYVDLAGYAGLLGECALASRIASGAIEVD